jgi:hypothetical protein
MNWFLVWDSFVWLHTMEYFLQCYLITVSLGIVSQSLFYAFVTFSHLKPEFQTFWVFQELLHSLPMCKWNTFSAFLSENKLKCLEQWAGTLSIRKRSAGGTALLCDFVSVGKEKPSSISIGKSPRLYIHIILLCLKRSNSN